MRHNQIPTDVCVIGGGPAGSSIAQRLSQFGHNVVLVEREASLGIRNIAASLPSSILPLVECLGLRNIIEEAGFARSERTIVWWSAVAPEVITASGQPGFHVDRCVFDRLLLENSRRHGVRILQPASAGRPTRRIDGTWCIPLKHESRIKEIIARFLVDASGGRLCDFRPYSTGSPLFALYAVWQVPFGEQTDGRLEAGEREWYWYAPVDNERSIVAVFIDPKRLSESPRTKVPTLYKQLIERFRLFRERHHSCIVGNVKACDASSRFSETPVGRDFIKVGDASFSIDPLSSQGIQSAIASAIQASIVVNTLIKNSTEPETAISFYRHRQQENLRRHSTKTAQFYRERAAVCDQPFWSERAAFDSQNVTPKFEDSKLVPSRTIRISGDAIFTKTPVISGERVVLTLAVHKETLERPFAFFDNIEIVPLLRKIGPGQKVDDVIKMWSQLLPVDKSWSILEWLWQRRIIVSS